MLALVLTVLAAGYGFAAGSWLPRPGYRLAVEAGAAWRADCPRGHALSGWLGTGRCPECVRGAGAVPPPRPYGPARFPLAVLTSALCAALAAAVGPRPELAVWLLLTPALVLLALIDVRVFRLPDVLTLTLPPVTVALLGLASVMPAAAGDWLTALLGGLALSAVYLLLFLIHPGGMGLGDVKLALTLGVVLGWYGWEALFLGTFVGFLTGGLYSTVLLLAGRATRKTGVPLGPFMVVGAFTGLVLGGLAV